MPADPIAVPGSLEGERLDRSLALLFDLSRSRATRLVDDGAVRLNGETAQSITVRLRSGDQLQVDSEALLELRPKLDPEPDLELDIIYADADLLVINKAAGMVVHPGVGNTHGTLIAGLVARFPDMADTGDPRRPGIIQRLDKGTSGLMLVARSQLAYDYLRAELAARRVQRHYVAVCAGVFEHNQGMVDAPIAKSSKKMGLMEVAPAGKEAQTLYEVQERLAAATVVHCQLKTGRTHQIRVHLAAIGHPLVGDKPYNPAPAELLATTELQQLFSGRPALHSRHLSCFHPSTKEELSFSQDMPADMAGLLEALR